MDTTKTSPHALEVERLRAEARELRAVLAEHVGKLPPDHAHMLAELRVRLAARRFRAIREDGKQRPAPNPTRPMKYRL